MKAWLAALVLAYVMPAYSVLRNVANARDKLELVGLRVEGSATVAKGLSEGVAGALGVQAGPGELQLPMSMSLRVPGRCRLELTSLESTKVVAAVTANGKRRTEGLEVPAFGVLVDELCALLAARGAGEGETRAGLERHLKGLKVDVTVSSLARFNGHIAYIVGATAAGSPQFWAYKEKENAVGEYGEKLLPARVRFADEKGVAWDVRMMDYTAMSTGDSFPRVVEIYQGDALQVRLTTLSADAKPKFDDKIF